MTLILGQDERRLGSTVETTSAPEEPAAQEIVVTATSCKEPVLLGAWRRPGAYANAIGSTFLFESEVDQDAVRRANFVCIHPCKELSTETKDLLRDIKIGLVLQESDFELWQVVAGPVQGCQGSEDITLLQSQPMALEDTAGARLVSNSVQERGRGCERVKL